MVKFIGPREIVDYINRKDVMIVDVREQKDYEEEHIINAINIPYVELLRKNWERKKNKILVLYCDRGNTSLKAALKLDKEGCNVITLTGGIEGIKTFYDN